MTLRVQTPRLAWLENLAGPDQYGRYPLINGCILDRGSEDDRFLIYAKTRLRREYTTEFSLVDGGRTAYLHSIVKMGRRQKIERVPPRQHVDFFRALMPFGLREMVLPDGDRYEIRSGIPGIRRVKDSDRPGRPPTQYSWPRAY